MIRAKIIFENFAIREDKGFKDFRDYTALFRWMNRQGSRWTVEFLTPKGRRIIGTDLILRRKARRGR